MLKCLGKALVGGHFVDRRVMLEILGNKDYHY